MNSCVPTYLPPASPHPTYTSPHPASLTASHPACPTLLPSTSKAAHPTYLTPYFITHPPTPMKQGVHHTTRPYSEILYNLPPNKHLPSQKHQTPIGNLFLTKHFDDLTLTIHLSSKTRDGTQSHSDSCRPESQWNRSDHQIYPPDILNSDDALDTASE